jgi:hypothetical protein
MGAASYGLEGARCAKADNGHGDDDDDDDTGSGDHDDDDERNAIQAGGVVLEVMKFLLSISIEHRTELK